MAKANTTRTEFSSALAQVAHERNLDPAVVLDTIKSAIVAAFKKDHPDKFKEDAAYEVSLDATSGEAHVFESPGETYEENGVTQVRAQKGATRVDVTPPGFGRIAAQTAKQVILQKIREAEKSNIVGEYEKRLGTLVNGMIIRFIGGEVIVDIGKAEAVMPRDQQVHSESYHLNQRLSFYIHSIRDSARGQEIVVSRADPNLIKELFRREVPEVNNSSVEIKCLARDPGSRTKIAVYSHQSGVDPVGSCVGQKGVRVQAVISELLGEKIDIVQYNDDPAKFVAAALSPAANLIVKIDDKIQVAQVAAPADQLSLAIGRDGQNAKLAGKLTGYHIDITGSDQPLAEAPAEVGTHERKEDTSSHDDNDQVPNPKSQ